MILWTAIATATSPGAIGFTEDGLERADGPTIGASRETTPKAQVVGGVRVAPSAYQDAAGIVFSSAYVGCTGTLIAPDLVVTAAHCLDGEPVTHALLGSTNWASEEGEAIEVLEVITHFSYDPGNLYVGRDIGLVKLVRPSSITPRTLVRGCLLDEVVDGAPVAIVGFGNTQPNGEGGTRLKNVGYSALQDADCGRDRIDGRLTGCVDEVRPGGEVIAGGRLDLDGDGQPDGIVDACFGDSGGPLYLETPYGEYLLGVTSRSLLGIDPDRPCRDGGIWVRPDAVISFLENQGGVVLPEPTCNLPPEGQAQTVVVGQGRRGKTELVVHDDDSAAFQFEIVEGTPLGEASLSGDQLVFRAHPDALGAGVVTIRVTDDGSDHPASLLASSTFEVRVQVVERACGCQNGPGESGLLALVGAWWMRKRRRQH